MGYQSGTASSLGLALVPVRSHGWPGKSIGSAPFSVRRCLSFQGLTPVSGVPAAENQALGNRNAPILPTFFSVLASSGPLGPRWSGSGHTPPHLRPWQWKRKLSAEQAHSRDVIRHLCDPSKPRADYGPTAQKQNKTLGFQKGRAPFVAFRSFWPVKRNPKRGASPPGWQAGNSPFRRTTPQSASQTAPLTQGSLWKCAASPQRGASPPGWQAGGRNVETTPLQDGAHCARKGAKPARFCIPFPLFFMLHLVEPFTIFWYTKR